MKNKVSKVMFQRSAVSNPSFCSALGKESVQNV